jgi:hypothetical protein
MKKTALALLLACAIVTPASAQPDDQLRSATFVIDHCRRVATDGTGSAEGIYCAGQVAGLFDAGRYLVPSARFCPPQGSTRHQALRVVITFLDANPLSPLALEAMRKAWPCR